MGVITRGFLDDQTQLGLSALSRLLGWVYTLAWSASFYPQVMHNYVHKSTRGLSGDFVLLNTLGHTSYLVYNTLLYFLPAARREYRDRHGGRDNVVQLNDFIFSLHATLLAIIILVQYLVYRTGEKVSPIVRLSLALALTIAVFLAGARAVQLVSWLHIIAAASTLKLLITLTKYIPQIHLNTQRKSTYGFSIQNIILDMIGGLLSLVQLFVDAVLIQHDWLGLRADWGKWGLGILSIAFDLVLIWQHYVVYGPVDVHDPQQHVQDTDDDQVQVQAETGRNTNYGATPHHAHAPTPSTRSPNTANTAESSSLLQ